MTGLTANRRFCRQAFKLAAVAPLGLIALALTQTSDVFAQAGTIQCTSAGGCTIQAGFTVSLSGESPSGQLFHRWSYANASNVTVFNPSATTSLSATGGRSTWTFNADGFQAADTRVITLLTCTNSAMSTGCATITRSITITAAPPPTFTCSTADCTVLAGQTITMAGDSSASRFRYQQFQWTNATGGAATGNADTLNRSWASSVPIPTAGFPAATPTSLRVTLVACNSNYAGNANAGSCASSNQIITIQSVPAATITCSTPGCRIPMGQQMIVTADSQLSRLPFHEWTWNNAANTPITAIQFDTNTAGFSSRTTFDANGFTAATTRTITLTACSNGYRTGTCTTSTQVVTVEAPTAPEISCGAGLACRTPAGSVLNLIGDSYNVIYRYHQWRLTGPTGVVTTVNIDTAASAARSITAWNTNGFSASANTVVRIQLTACAAGYNSGSCATAFRDVTVEAVPLGTVLCPGGTCSAQAGTSILLNGDSQGNRLRYHEWRLRNSAGAFLTTGIQYDTIDTGYRSTINYSLVGFNGTTVENVELHACSGGYRSGTCTITIQPVTISAPPAPVIGCSTIVAGVCTVRAGYTIDLFADATNSRLSQHNWRWTNSAGTLVTTNVNTNSTGFGSRVSFSADGFRNTVAQDVTVDVGVCTATNRGGTCATATRVVRVLPPANATITCQLAGCRIPAGQVMHITGTSTLAILRYHRWTWSNSANTAQTVDRDTENAAYTSAINFDANGFTAGSTRQVNLQTCSTGYNAGTCITTSVTVNVDLPTIPTITCPASGCTVQAGLSIELLGDSTASRFRYHRWTWNNSANVAITPITRDSINGDYRSSVTFSADGWAPTTNTAVQVTLQACTNGYNSGSCVSRTTPIQVTPGPATGGTITCAPADCTVQINGTLRLFGDTTASQYPFHRWTNLNPTATVNRDGTLGGFQSSTTFSAAGLAAGTRTITLTACAAGFATGSCYTITRNITIVAQPAVVIRCDLPTCAVAPGQTIVLTGDSRNFASRAFHYWIFNGGTPLSQSTGTAPGTGISSPTFTAPATPGVITVSLQSCSGANGTGTCSTPPVTQQITVAAPPAPEMTCLAGNPCTVRAGQSVNIIAETNNSYYRYHEWTWLNPYSQPITPIQRDTDNNNNASTVTFSAAGYNVTQDTPVTLTVRACKSGFNNGACVVGTQVVVVQPALAVPVTCTPATCTVIAGQTIGLTADSVVPRLRYHEWRWHPANTTQYFERYDTLNTSYRSRTVFNADGFLGSSSQTVELWACSDSYRVGTCVVTQRTINIAPDAAPTIYCVANPNCEVMVGNTLRVSGDAFATSYPYHEWRWFNPTGGMVITTVNTAGSEYRSTVSYVADGFNTTTPMTQVVQLTACDQDYRTGSCTTAQRTVTLLPPAIPTITCANGPCNVDAGRPLTLYGQGSTSRLRWHRWRWNNADGAVVETDVDGGTANFRTSVAFTADGFQAAGTRQVTLIACATGYGTGTCSTNAITVNVLAPPAPLITCQGGVCSVIQGGLLRLTGDSNLSGYPYHEWRWTNPGGSRVLTNRTTPSPGFRSTVTFDAAGQQVTAPTVVTAELRACAINYGQGSCATTMQTITIRPSVNPSITCDPGTCRVQAGLTMRLIGTSSTSGYPFHEWTWPNSAGGDVVTQVDTTSGSFTSNVVFTAAGFAGTGGAAPIELIACSTGYRIGSCVTQTRTVTVDPPAAPTITCSSGAACDVAPGGTIDLVGNSQTSLLRYHEWRWTDPSGSRVLTQRNTASTAYRGVVTFNAAGFGAATPQTVVARLTACGTNYTSGTCVEATRTITIRPLPTIRISCFLTGGACSVTAGGSVVMTGDAAPSALPFHEYRWLDVAGVLQIARVTAVTNIWRTDATFSAVGFTSAATRSVELVACSANYGSGTCATTTTNVTINPAVAGTITCNPSVCRVYVSQSIDLIGNAANSNARFHTWRWTDPAGALVTRDIDAGATFRSTTTLNATGYTAATTRNVELLACTTGFGMGTCNTITRTVTFDAAPASLVTCASGANCTVQAGLTLSLNGDSTPSRYRYHAWRFDTPNGGVASTNVDTVSSYRSSATFSAVGFQPTTPILVNAELYACTTGYLTGNCSSRTQVITVTPPPAADINCGVGVTNCRVQAGQTITFQGDGTGPSFRWHRWQWREADNLLQQFDRDGGTLFTSTQVFNSVGFEAPTGSINRTITLIACSTTYATGTCTTTTRNLEIYAAPPPTILCANGPTCEVKAGASMNLEGDSGRSLYRYHQWRWLNSAQVPVTTNVDVAGGGYASTVTFSATDFQLSTRTPVPVLLVACTGGYGAGGSCVQTTQVVTITPAASTNITCEPASCRVQGGLTLPMFADARANRLPYLTWRYRNAASGIVVTNQNVGGTGFVGTLNFNADGFTTAASRNVEVIACSSGYRTGACTTDTRVVSIDAPPTPIIACTGGPCQVLAGATLEINGDSIAAQFRYHDWRWTDAAGRQVVQQLDAALPAYRSTAIFNASGFQGTQPQVVIAELNACDQTYRTGACASRTQEVTVLPAPPAIITCSTGVNCDIDANDQFDIAGDSSRSSFRWHTWRWRDSNGALVQRQFNTVSTGFRSTVQFVASGFSQTSTRGVELMACSDSYTTGSCTRTVQRVNIDVPRGAEIACASGDACDVVAGNILNLTGDSSSPRLAFHEWRWATPSGTLIVTRVNTANSQYLSTVPFNADGFPGDVETRVTAQLVACGTNYRLGTCSTITRQVVITPVPEPDITCVTGAVCQVQGGYTLGLTGATRGSPLRWHTWEWRDAAGSPVITNVDGGTGPLSSVTFNAASFEAGATRTITLTACTGVPNVVTYLSGTCRSSSVEVSIVAPTPLSILCDPTTCSVQPGFNLVLTGDGAESQLRFHRYTWNDANGNPITPLQQTAAGAPYRTSVTFNATGFAPGTRDIMLEACSTGYGMGTCQNVTRTIRIEAAPLPEITCTNSPNCTIQQGLTVNLIGDSSTSLFRYHEYRWRNAFGALVVQQVDTNATGFSSAVPFDANGFQSRNNISVAVELNACQTNYRTGSCRAVTRNITLTPAPEPEIDCLGDNGCTIQAGRVLTMRGNSVASRFRYQSWRWRDGTRTTINTNLNTINNGYLSTVTFPTDGYVDTTTENIELTACGGNFRSGTCVTRIVPVTIQAAPRPTMICLGPEGCPVQAGQSITLQADAGNSALRYHEWRWRLGAGELTITQRDTAAGAYISTVVFNAAGYNVTAPTPVVAELSVCSTGYRTGSCATQTLNVTVMPATAPLITCEPATCRVQTGRSIVLTGNSNTSLFRYHEWRWRNAAGVVTITRIDSGVGANRSTVTFPASAFQTPGIQTVELYACSTNYRSGSCVTTTRGIQVEAAPPPTIACGDGSGCSVRAGGTIDLLGDAFNSGFRYHEWRWTNATGALVITQRDTNASSFRSSVTFDAARFQNAAPLTIRAELVSCDTNYSLGSCVSNTTNVVVTPAVAPTIQCLSVAGCNVTVPGSISIVGSSSFALLRYHEWTWNDVAGAQVITQFNTAGTGYRSTVTFPAAAFLGADSRVVTLTACSGGYRTGTCTVANQTLTILPPVGATIDCSPVTCRTLRTGTITLTGNGSGGRYRFHEWQWTNASNVNVINRLDGGATFRTNAVFSGQGFNAQATRTVTLTACTNGFRLGACTVVTRGVAVDTQAAPTLTCQGGPCNILAGGTLRLTLDSTRARLRYHDVRWRDSGGVDQAFQRDSGTTYRSNINVTAHGYQNATTIPVRAAACTGGYYSGNCGTVVQNLTVIPPGPSSISCNPTTCRVQAGRSLPLIGTSTSSRLPYHEWTWRDAAGNVVATRRATGSSAYRSSVSFPASGFQAAQTQVIELSTCSSNYRTGTCVFARRTITVDAAPAPGITCASGPACDVQAGLPLTLQGYARASGFRYHEWRWPNANGAIVITQRDSNGSSFRSTVTFLAENYNNTTPQTSRVELTACDTGYRAGICVTSTQLVTIRPAPLPTILCGTNPATCQVQAGKTIVLTGDSIAPRFIYHEWRWFDAAAAQVITQRNTGTPTCGGPTGTSCFGYRSNATFSADRFQAGAVRTIELVACQTGFAAGACVTATRNLTVIPAEDPIITCVGPDGCNVRQGRPLEVAGDAVLSGFRWHEWSLQTAFGGQTIVQRDTSATGFRSQATFSADDFEGAANQVATVRLTVCTQGYGLGSCESASRTVNVLPALAPTIDCLLANCVVPSGQTTDVYGDSRTSQLRWHQFQWLDSAGALVVTQRDTLNSGNRSTVTFSAANFDAANDSTRTVELIACASGYLTGTCARTTRVVTIMPPQPGFITCDPRTCNVQLGFNLTLTGNTVLSQVPFHRWRWNNAGNAPITPISINAGTGNVSTVTFATTGFANNTTRTITLTACSTGYDTGTCVTITRDVVIQSAPLPTLSCEIPSCRLQQGLAMRIYADSDNSQFRYHDYRWTNSNGTQTIVQLDSLNGGYLSVANYNSEGYVNANDVPITVDFQACTGSGATLYRAGSCVSRTLTITLTPPPPPVIRCATPDCSVQRGLTLNVTGSSTISLLPYHSFQWPRAPSGTVTNNLNTSNAGYRSTFAFDANNYTLPTFVNADLSTCASGFRNGRSCSGASRTITILDAPRPTVSCLTPNGQCEIPPGQRLEIVGNSFNSQFRYHDYRWNGPTGAQVTPVQRDTVNNGFASTAFFNSAGFNPTARSEIPVTLTACTNGYLTGSCTSLIFIVTILPPAPAIITCTPANCRVQAGLTLELVGDSAASTLRYHNWRWRNSANSADVNTNVDTESTGFDSLVTYSAEGFNGSSTQPVTLTVCSDTYFNLANPGSCAITVQNVFITTAPPPSIFCRAGTNCVVPGGADLELTGSSTAARFRYHSWRWTNAAGMTVTTELDSEQGDYRSSITFSAIGYPPAGGVGVPIELMSCTRTGRAGSCVSTTRVITVGAIQPATIACSEPNCSVQAGKTMALNGDGSAGALRFHEWRWNNVNDVAITPIRVDTTATDNQSSVDFSADGYQAGATRTVTLIACSAGYLTGTCSTTTQMVTIRPAPAPILTCASGPSCRVVAGQPLVLTLTSSTSEFAYQEYRLPGPTGAVVSSPRFLVTAPTFQSTQAFATTGFSTTMTTMVNVVANVCMSNYNVNSCVSVTRQIIVVPSTGTAQIISSAVTPFTQPERADYRFEADRPADWTVTLFRRVGGTCTTDVIYRTTAAAVAGVTGTWVGLSPGGSYCYTASITPTGTNTTVTNNFTLPALPEFTSGPTAMVDRRSATITAATSVAGTGSVEFEEGLCTSRPTGLAFTVSSFATVRGPVIPAAGFTLEAWINLNGIDSQDARLFSYGGVMELQLQGGALRFLTRNPNDFDVVATSTVPAERWSHIAAIFEPGQTLRVYVNGRNVGQDTVPAGSLTPDLSGLMIGDSATGGFLGELSSVAVYNRPLTTAELLAHTAAGPTVELPRENNRVAAWQFNEAAGVQSIYDAEGNHWAGVLGADYRQELGDPDRRPLLTRSVTAGTGTNLSATLSNLTGGPDYCYRVRSETASGVITTLPATFRRAPDNTPPVISTMPIVVVECEADESAAVTLTTPAVTDDEDPSPTIVPTTVTGEEISFPAAFPLGSSIVRWVARDATGNVATADQTVRVRDVTRPEVDPGDPVIVEARSPMGTAFTPVPDSATDSCSAVTISSNAPALFQLGDTTVTFTVNDSSSNPTTAQRVVRVVDTTPPVFDPPLASSMPVIPFDGSACFTPRLQTPRARDNGYAEAMLTFTSTRTTGPGEGECWEPGVHLVEWTVTDPAGNFTVDVQQVEIRVIDTRLMLLVDGLSVDGMPAQPNRWYNRPVNLTFSVMGGTAPYQVTVIPEPTRITESMGTFTAVFEDDGNYASLTINVRDGNGRGGGLATQTIDGFGLDRTPPVIAQNVISQTRVEIGNFATYPTLFIGEELPLEPIRARDGTSVPTGLATAVTFDGGDVLVVREPAEGLTGTGTSARALTAETWVRVTAGTSTGTVLSKRIGADQALAIELVGGRPRFTVRTGGQPRTLISPSVADGRFHHLAMTYDGRVMRTYVDGLPSQQRALSGTVQLGSEDTSIGARVVNGFAEGYFTGDLSEIAIWRTALSEATLAMHYRGGMGRAVLPNADAVLILRGNVQGQRVLDTSGRGNDGQLGLTAGDEADDPRSAPLVAPAIPGSSGLVSLTARLVEPTTNASSPLVTTASSAVGAPLPMGFRAMGGRVCTAPLGSACNLGDPTLTADNVSTWDMNRRRAYHIEIEAFDAAGNRASLRVGFRVQDYAGALADALTAITAMQNNPLNFLATNELAQARSSLEVARSYTTMARRYFDGSYLRADQGIESLFDAQDLNVDIGTTGSDLSRAMAGDILRYVQSVRPTLADDRQMYTDAETMMGDARFARFMGRWSDVDALSRNALDAVALLYPAYQPMRAQRRSVHQRWEDQINDFAAGRTSAEPMRTDATRLIRTQALAGATRDMLANVLYPEITAALANPFTTERVALEEIRDVLDKTASTGDEAGDLIAITNGAIMDACLDRLASLTLDDRIFTTCYLRLNDLARLLDGVSEPLVHTYRWRAGLALALFNMLEISMNTSPTGLPWVTSDAASPEVRLVLPDARAATVPNAVRVSAVDQADGALARAYNRYDAALAELGEGDVNRAWSIFVDERCLLLNLYNRYYSMDRATPNVSDPKEAPIDPMMAGCMMPPQAQ